MDKIGTFSSLCDATIIKQFSKHYHVIRNTRDNHLSKTDAGGRSAIQIIYFQQAHSAIDFLKLRVLRKRAEKYLRFAFQKNLSAKKQSY